MKKINWVNVVIICDMIFCAAFIVCLFMGWEKAAIGFAVKFGIIAIGLFFYALFSGELFKAIDEMKKKAS